MTITISDICNQWGCSRTTVMKAIKNEKLIGSKDADGKWIFEIDNVIRWRGAPKSSQPTAEEQVQEAVETIQTSKPDPAHEAVIQAKDDMISMLQEQLAVKDQQLQTAQDTLQTKLLEDQRRDEENQKGFFRKLFS